MKASVEGKLILAIFLAFGLLIGCIFGAAFRDTKRDVRSLKSSVGDLSIRMAAVERALPGGGPDALRDIVGDVSVRVGRVERVIAGPDPTRLGRAWYRTPISVRIDRLEQLAILNWQLDRWPDTLEDLNDRMRGSQPAVPGQELGGMRIPGDDSGDQDP